MRHVPWHVKGIRPEVREVARDAARRSGLSIGAWLNSLIVDAAIADGAGHQDAAAGGGRNFAPVGAAARFRPTRAGNTGLAAIRRDIDELKRHVQRQSRGNAAPIGMWNTGDVRGRQLLESIARIERRLEGLGRTGNFVNACPDPKLGAGDVSAGIAGRQECRAPDSTDTDDWSTPAVGHEMSPPQVRPAIFESRDRDAGAGEDAPQRSKPHNREADIWRIAERAAPEPAVEAMVEALRRHFAEFRGTLRDTTPPIEEIAKVWRQDLMEISAALRDAMPTSAIAALEEEVRLLGERLEVYREPEAVNATTAGIEQALAGIRDRLQALTPAEELAELSHAVGLLSRKADLIAANSTAPEKIRELEHAIDALQGVVSQVASRDIVAAMSDDIRALSDKIDCSDRPAVDSAFMNSLERRLAEIAEAVGSCRPGEGGSVPATFDTVIKVLADRLEAIQIPTADQGILKSLEQRIDTLVNKLGNPETRSAGPEGADRGMEELLAQVRELRAQNENRLAAIQQQIAASAADAISGPAESIRRDVASLKEIQTSVDRRTQDTFEAVYGTIEQVVDRLTTIEDGLRDGQYGHHADQPADSPEWLRETAAAHIWSAAATVGEAPALVPLGAPSADHVASTTQSPPPYPPPLAGEGRVGAAIKAPSAILSAHPSPHIPLRHPAVSGFAPDAPLEPGSGARRPRVVTSAIDRIAASEATSGAAKPAETVAPVRTNFVAAARRAARAVASEHEGTATAAGIGKVGQNFRRGFAGSWFGTLRPRTAAVALGAGAIMLALGVFLAFDFFHNRSGAESAQPVTQADDAVPSGDESIPSVPESPLVDQNRKGAHIESPRLSPPGNTGTLRDEATLGTPLASALQPDMVVVAAIRRPAVTSVPAMMSGTTAPAVASPPMRNPLLRWPVSQSASPPVAAARDLTEIPLPQTIGGRVLIAAASAGEPGASYEVALRFAQGRNAPQDLAMAAAWFERAARSGSAPAQFRLGSMYEKGIGVKKDLTEARRLYLAAADKGNAKAMHNLAVLYAEALDGKPDYAVASQWFQRAAAHGIVDSQYNLAILYARGIGVERNTVESYKWFALAAKGGDKDAARKRDEVAAHLDHRQLESAKLNVESFVAEPQPDEAITAKAPPGGWDQVVAAATTKSRTAR
ncbi:MAG TPA: hypothetical protein VKP67_19025 [Xanthobacteraceae bacterium]|nr:hypothetical protein [Xanthobacteraceae bacterium]